MNLIFIADVNIMISGAIISVDDDSFRIRELPVH